MSVTTQQKLVAVEVPKATRPGKQRFDQELLHEAETRLQGGETLALDETYETRTEAQVGGFYLRQAVAAQMGVDPKRIGSRTWEAEDGLYRFAITLKPETDDQEEEPDSKS